MKALKAIAVFSLSSSDVKNTVHELGTFCIEAFRPVVASALTASDEVIRVEDAADGAATQGQYLSVFKVTSYTSRNESCVVSELIIDVQSLVGKIVVAVKAATSIDVVLAGNCFPKLSENLKVEI